MTSKRSQWRPMKAASGLYLPTAALSSWERTPQTNCSRVEPLNCSSRREEALIDFGFRISDFGFGVMSLTSAATRFMGREHLQKLDRSGRPSQPGGQLFPPPEPRGTSNIEHPTPNIEWQRGPSLTSAFGVRCWTFDVFPPFRGSNARIFISGKSLPEGQGQGEGGAFVSA